MPIIILLFYDAFAYLSTTVAAYLIFL